MIIDDHQDNSIFNFKEKFSKPTFKELTGHKKRVYTLDWNYTGNRLISGSVDCNLKLWDLESEKVQEMKGHSDSVTHVKFSNSEENIFLSCSSDKTVKLWDVRTGKNIRSEKTKTGCKNLVWNADSSIFAYSNKEDNMISFCDYRKFQVMKQIEFKNQINEFVFDYAHSYVLITSSTGSLNVLSEETLDESNLTVIDAHYPLVNAIDIERSNRIFATGAADALICLWDMEELMSYKVIKKGEIPIRKVNFSHDGKLIASIYEGSNLDIFEVESGQCVHTIFTESQQYCIAWHPTMYILAYCGDDKNRNNVDEGNIHILSI